MVSRSVRAKRNRRSRAAGWGTNLITIGEHLALEKAYETLTRADATEAERAAAEAALGRVLVKVAANKPKKSLARPKPKTDPGDR